MVRKQLVALGIILSISAACGAKALTPAAAQKAVDEWVAERSARDTLGLSPDAVEKHRRHLAEVLEQNVLDLAVKRTENSGKRMSEAEYSRLEEQAKLRVIERTRAGNPVNVVRVLGVQELSAQSEATADLDMSGFAWGPSDSVRTTTSLGKAYFTHYNDGRWVLSKVQWEGGSLQEGLNITVR